MAKSLGQIGAHREVVDLEDKDVNGRPMYRCNSCSTFTRDPDHFKEAHVPCIPFDACPNCKALKGSFDRQPAVPEGGTCNDVLHICPFDGRRWWQGNGHFHMWQQVTDIREWEAVESWGTPRDKTPSLARDFYG
jgi:hypothetical protein